MPYLGNEPAVAFTSTTKDTFSGDASTTDFTMSKAANVNAVRVVVENVVQDPSVAYTCSGTTLSFTSAPPTGTNNIYVVHLGPPAATVAPPTTINNNTTFTGGVSLKNETPEDTDGGRESKVTFKGLQSGEEESTLAEIQASHDGTSDDEKGDLIFKTNDGSDGTSPTEAMRIQSDQSILFGSPTTDDDQKFQMIKTSGSVGLGLHSNRAAAGGSALILSHNRNNAIGSFTALNDDDQLGRITFQGSDGTDIKTEGAQIHAEINGTVGSNDLPTDLVFSTNVGAAAIAEALRLSNAVAGSGYTADTGYSVQSHAIMAVAAKSNSGANHDSYYDFTVDVNGGCYVIAGSNHDQSPSSYGKFSNFQVCHNTTLVTLFTSEAQGGNGSITVTKPNNTTLRVTFDKSDTSNSSNGYPTVEFVTVLGANPS